MKKNQILLSKLIFTQNWEDPQSDLKALQIKPGESLFCITSGGCNALGFLRFDPGVIYSVDINASQSWLMELKIAAMRNFSHDDFVAFMGLTETDQRPEMYNSIKKDLTPEALYFWDCQKPIISKGLLMHGRFESFIRLAGRFIRLLQGSKKVEQLFAEKSHADQIEYFDTIWNTRRFQFLFKILFNKHILAKRGLVEDYFHFDDGSKSFSETFYKRSVKAFRDIPIAGNYFLSLYLSGKYRNTLEVPDYLKPEYCDFIKSRLERITIITSDAQSFLDKMPSDCIDCFALSNICELMNEEETSRLFYSVYRTVRSGSRIIFRNLIIPREVPADLSRSIIKEERLSTSLFKSDRSFVYGKVNAYAIVK